MHGLSTPTPAACLLLGKSPGVNTCVFAAQLNTRGDTVRLCWPQHTLPYKMAANAQSVLTNGADN